MDGYAYVSEDYERDSAWDDVIDALDDRYDESLLAETVDELVAGGHRCVRGLRRLGVRG